MQDLGKYLEGKRKRDFAELVGIAPAYLSQILGKQKRPSFDLMVRIEEATGGAVPLDAWKEGAAK